VTYSVLGRTGSGMLNGITKGCLKTFQCLACEALAYYAHVLSGFWCLLRPEIQLGAGNIIMIFAASTSHTLRRIRLHIHDPDLTL